MGTLASTMAMSCSGNLQRQSLRRFGSILGVAAFLLLTQGSAWAHRPEHPGVLILYHRQKEAPYAQVLRTEVTREVGQRLSGSFDVFADSIDGWSGTDDEGDKALLRVLKHRYARLNVHLLIPVGNEPVAFARLQAKELFPEASIVYMAESFTGKPDLPPMLDATGVNLHFDAEATLQLALQQNPGTRKVVVVAGISPQEREELLCTRREFRRYEDSLEFQYVTDVSLAQLLARVSRLPNDSIIIVLNFSRDRDGEEFIGAQILPSIARASSRPIYVVYSPGVGAGAVGGVVHDFGRVGRALGGRAAEVLKGKRAGDLPVIEGAFQQAVFDWRQMQRWGIAESQLPAGAIVLNREVSAWQRYHWWIIGAAAIILTQAALIAFLVVARLRKARAERELAGEVELEGLISELAAAFVNLPSGKVAGQIEHSCIRLLRFFYLDRIALFEFSPGKDEFHLLYSYRSAGIDAFPAGFRAEQTGWMTAQVLAGRPVLISRMEDLPPEASADREYLAGRGVRSFAVFPLADEQTTFGILVLSAVQQEVQWPPRVVGRLQTISHIFANALEKKRAEEAMRASEDLKARILDSMISHIAVINRSGRILSANKVWKEYWTSHGGGPDAAGSTEFNYLDVCRKAALAGCRDADRALAGILSVLDGKSETFEMEYDSSAAGQPGAFVMVVTPLLHAGDGAVIRHRDITFRTQALGMLRESEERFRLVADSAPVMIWMAGPDRLCNYFNKFWLDFRGRSMEQEWGNGWRDGIHAEDLFRCLRIYNESFDTRRPFTMEYRLHRGDGEYRWVLESGVPRNLPDGSFAGFIGACVDIAEQKESDRARAQLSGLLITAQEQERASIARELHDHVNQRLALLAIELQQFELAAHQLSPREREELERLWDLTNDISHDVQALSHQLHSSQLQHLGLVAGLRSLCQEFSRGNEVEAECRCSGAIPRIDENVSLALFRVAQEALRNVSKYSHARAVAAELQSNHDALTLRVIDDGIGFDPATTNGGGLGLISMRERMRLVGGELVIHSQPGAGTRIEARIPLVHVPVEKIPPDTPARVERRKRMRA